MLLRIPIMSHNKVEAEIMLVLVSSTGNLMRDRVGNMHQTYRKTIILLFYFFLQEQQHILVDCH